MLLLRFLAAMFNNKYKKVFDNQDFLNRLTIINLKNSSSYDKRLGAITTTFFPINSILLIFIIPVIYLRNDRLNEMVLKAQYFLLIMLYCLLALMASVFILPILFFKSVANSFYILFKTKR